MSDGVESSLLVSQQINLLYVGGLISLVSLVVGILLKYGLELLQLRRTEEALHHGEGLS